MSSYLICLSSLGLSLLGPVLLAREDRKEAPLSPFPKKRKGLGDIFPLQRQRPPLSRMAPAAANSRARADNIDIIFGILARKLEGLRHGRADDIFAILGDLAHIYRASEN